MSPERWTQIKDIFFEALNRPLEARTAYLREACGNDADLRAAVEELLASETAPLPILDATQADFAAFVDETGRNTSANPMLGRTIGPYEVVRELGQGGMGTVYLGVRHEPFKQYVALKLVRPGLHPEIYQRRFEVERQILASLTHPNIARLLDGGSTEEGLAYLVMEYVDGVPFTQYCDTQQLDIDARLDLFRTVCRAVHYAHQNLIVHRDLKPSNILVTPDGHVKLLDFGVAKLLNPTLSSLNTPITLTHSRPMTPEYAAPEQVRGEAVTTATDVYALGVLLYELLTGYRPYQLASSSALELERVICQQTPTFPSAKVNQAQKEIAAAGSQEPPTHAPSQHRNTTPERLARQLRGDLDTIVLAALRKEPFRRYASAEHLMADIERHLNGLPVTARRDTRRYRLEKYIRRHRLGVAASLLIVLLIVSFGLVSLWQATQLRESSKQATLEAKNAEAVTTFLIDLFRASSPYLTGSVDTLRVADFVALNTERVWDELQEQPAVRARLLRALSEVNRHLSNHDEASRMAEEALTLTQSLYEGAHPELIQSMRLVAIAHKAEGNYEEAGRQYREALQLGHEHNLDHPSIAQLLDGLADLYAEQGKLDEAEATWQEAIALYQQHDGPNVARSAYLHHALGNFYRVHKDDPERAEEHLLLSIELNRQQYGRKSIEVGTNLAHLGNTYRTQQRYAEAETAFKEAIEIVRETRGPEHPWVPAMMNDLALTYHSAGKLAAADSTFALTIQLNRTRLGERHERVAANHINWARTLLALGEPLRADSLGREAIQRYRQIRPPGHWHIAFSEGIVAKTLVAQERYAEAEPFLVSEYETYLAYFGPEHNRTQSAKASLFSLYTAWNRPAKARPYCAEPCDPL